MTLPELETLVAEMRRLGVRSFRDNGIEIELGDPPGAITGPRELSPGEVVARGRADKQRVMNTLFGASSHRPRIPESDNG